MREIPRVNWAVNEIKNEPFTYRCKQMEEWQHEIKHSCSFLIMFICKLMKVKTVVCKTDVKAKWLTRNSLHDRQFNCKYLEADTSFCILGLIPFSTCSVYCVCKCINDVPWVLEKLHVGDTSALRDDLKLGICSFYEWNCCLIPVCVWHYLQSKQSRGFHVPNTI